MYIQCTKALIDKLDIERNNLQSGEKCDDGADGFYSWHADLILLNNKETIVCMNNMTGYVIVLYSPEEKDIEEFGHRLKDGIRAVLRGKYIREDAIEEYLKRCGEIMFSTTAGGNLDWSLDSACESIQQKVDLLDEESLLQERISIYVGEHFMYEERYFEAVSTEESFLNTGKGLQKVQMITGRTIWSGFRKKICEMMNLFSEDWRPLLREDVLQEMKKRNQLDKLIGRGYATEENAGERLGVWNEAVTMLLDILYERREKNPNDAKDLADLNDAIAGIDFAYDVVDWLEDYLSYLDTMAQYDRLEDVCGKLLVVLNRYDQRNMYLCFYENLALKVQGKKQEALEFCEKWYEIEKDTLALTELIYAKMNMGDFEGAQKLAMEYILDDAIYSDENEPIFSAASVLAGMRGDREAEERIRQVIF